MPTATTVNDAEKDQSASFAELGLSEPLLRAIDKFGWERPTRVQSEMIPPALAGKDILAQSRTGTGKTAAFGLPILQRLVPDTPFQTLILAPTRELAVQVGEDLRKLSHFTPVTVVPVYGGQRIRIQADRLQRKPAVARPGHGHARPGPAALRQRAVRGPGRSGPDARHRLPGRHPADPGRDVP
ncbi:MAG: DEAD/DEAH box helicase [Planctomycetota bacterium]|jgi:superfamily II DNA/RNA helicase